MELQIVELADRLHLEGAELVNHKHYNFSTNDSIKIISHNLEIMKQPFALMGDTIIFAETSAISLNIV